jgi:predicted ArsR family transcriptional regulator
MYNLFMQLTRQRILSYLEEHQTASAIELGRVFSMTKANIRHHLNTLQRNGHIEVIGKRQGGGRGRPTLIYAITRSSQTNNLEVLSTALLEELLISIPKDRRDSRLRKVAARLAGEASADSSTLTKQLIAAVQRLNQMNYRSRWEAHADAPHIILRHCPFAAIINRHPELCQLDANIIEELVQHPVQLLSKRTWTHDGPQVCTFTLTE